MKEEQNNKKKRKSNHNMNKSKLKDRDNKGNKGSSNQEEVTLLLEQLSLTFLVICFRIPHFMLVKDLKLKVLQEAPKEIQCLEIHIIIER